MKPSTLAAQALHQIDELTGGVVPALQPSTTFVRDEGYAPRAGFTYQRDGSPGVEEVERVLAALDEGTEARLFAAGAAAAAALFETLQAGDHVIAPRVMYYAIQAWLKRLEARRGIALSLIDATDPEALEAAIRPGATRLVWLECPSNPIWDVVDIAHAAQVAHAAGAILAVDATAAPPCTMRPLGLGADLVFHATTKYLNGHSDALGGVLVTRELDARWREIGLIRKLTGSIMAPFEAWLLLRGLRTLFLRFERASATALKIAERLERHPRIERVLYPGLESHPGHAIARRQMEGGFGGMLSILVKGSAEDALSVARRTRLFLPATSFGGVESLIEHRKSIEGPESPVPDNLLRLSVGIEDADDLEADLRAALEG